MDFKEKEYRKAFMFYKRWANHWLTPSAHRAHSSTIGMKEPAQKTLDFINSIDTKEKSYKEKYEQLNAFYIEQEQIQKNSKYMGTSYYFDCLQYHKKINDSISEGESIIIPKISK